MYSLVIFDWDGTLMDSTERIVSCLAKAARKTQLPVLADASYQHIIGLGLREAIRYLYPDIDEPTIEVMRQHYADCFIAAENTPSPLFHGALDVLNVLRDNNIKTAVATGKSRAGLDRVWHKTGLGKYFDASRCADETVSKPHPRMLEEILSELGVKNDRALMIGDTSFDLEMAANVSMPSIGVSYGAHDVATLQQHNPLAIIDNMAQLLPLALKRIS